MIWYCTGWTTSLLLLARIALCAPAKEREVERGSGAQSGKTPFHFRFSPSNGATDLGRWVGRCGVRRLRLLRLAPVAAARHALHANEFQANQYPFPALPASLSLSPSLSAQCSHSASSTLSTLREGGGGNGARSIFEICNCRGFYSVC